MNNNEIDKWDGFRFKFVGSSDNLDVLEMWDELGEFKPVTLPTDLATILLKIFSEQHEYRQIIKKALMFMQSEKKEI